MAWVTDTGLWGQLLRLSCPAIVEQVLIFLVSMIATAMIGHISTAALGAVGVVNMTVQTIQALICMLSVGVTVIVARLYGEGNLEDAREAGRQALLGGIVIAVALPLLLWVFAEPILRTFMSKVEQDVFDNAMQYYLCLLPGLPLFILNLIVSGIVRGAGDMRHPMVTALLVNVLSVLMGYPLIFGLGPVPALGIAGAGIGMSVARTAGGVILLLVLMRGKTYLRVPWKGLFHLDWGMLKRVLRVGIPASVEQVALVGGNLVVQVIIAMLTTNEIASYQVSGAMGAAAFYIISGFGMAATTLTGQYLGAGKPEKARRIAWQSATAGTIVSNLLYLAVCLFAVPITSVFSSDPAVVARVTELLPTVAVCQVLISAVNVIPAALRGGGDIMFVTWTNIATSIFRVGGTYVLTQYAGFGAEALYYTMFVDFICRSASYMWRVEKGPWLTRKV